MTHEYVTVQGGARLAYRFDTRGHGASDTTPGPYTIAFRADDVIAMLDALGLGRVHFAGLSMGGMIGQQLGTAYGDRMHSLALCDTASEMPDTTVWKQRLEVARRDAVAALAAARALQPPADRVPARDQGLGAERTGFATLQF